MSNLQFQEPAVDVPLRLRSFYGRNIDQMPLLLSGKDESGKVVDVPRDPITPKQLLYMRVHYMRVHGANEHDRDLLRDNYVDTACAVITDSDGSGEVVVGLYNDAVVRELINSLNPETESALQRGSLPVSADYYQAVRKNGFVIASSVANSLRNNAYSEKKVREAFWDYVAEGDARLVMDNLALVQKRKGEDMKDRMGLGLWLSSNPGLRLLCVGSVDDDSSYAYGDYSGRLVGVASEALVARENSAHQVSEKPLENRI